MDARVQLATTDAERWTYVASSLEETAQSNAQTAAILERLTARLDASDRRISALEEYQVRSIERDLDQRRQACDTHAETDEHEETSPTLVSVPAVPTTLAGVLNRIYNDARIVFLAGGFGGGVLATIITHVGLSWH